MVDYLLQLISEYPMIGTISSIFGDIGSFLFAFCNVPSIIKVYRRKSAEDISALYIIMTIFANMTVAEYVFYCNVLKGIWQIPLYFNYGFCWLCCVVLLYLKYKYRKPKK